jgi:hypothetical protein
MANILAPLRDAHATRDLARRAKRLGQNLRPGADQTRLIRYAEELEEQAAWLEADASEPLPFPIAPIPQMQKQIRQQQQLGSSEVNGSTSAKPKS